MEILPQMRLFCDICETFKTSTRYSLEKTLGIINHAAFNIALRKNKALIKEELFHKVYFTIVMFL
jgi:hypothetical protein